MRRTKKKIRQRKRKRQPRNQVQRRVEVRKEARNLQEKESKRRRRMWVFYSQLLLLCSLPLF